MTNIEIEEQLCSRRDPAAEAEQWIKTLPILLPHQILGLIGLGKAHHLKQLIKDFRGKVIVFESRANLVEEFALLNNEPQVQVVHLTAENLPVIAQQYRTQLDLVIPFRPSFGKFLDMYVQFLDQVVGDDIKTMSTAKWTGAEKKWHSHLDLLQEIIK